MRKLFSLVAVLALGSTLVACGSGDDKNSTGDFDKAGIKVTGDYGKKPTITHRDGDPDKTLVTEVLKEGDGPEVEAQEMVTFDYFGAVWGEKKPFDESFSREPTAFAVGVNSLIPAWDQEIPGLTRGSRVMIIAPPDSAYGDQDQPNIPGGSTLVFVVDVLGVDA